MYNVERFLSGAQKHFDTTVGATEVEKAAEEFKDIQQKKADEEVVTLANLNFLREHNSALARLNAMFQHPEGRLPMQWLEEVSARHAPDFAVGVWVQAVEDLLERQCSDMETDLIQKLVRGNGLHLIAAVSQNCWEIAKRLVIRLVMKSRSTT